MKKAHVTRDPIARFPLPVNVPESVAPYQERFEILATQWARTKGEIDDAEQELKQAAADDIKRAAAAFGEGKEPDPSTNAEPEAKAKLEGLRERLAALSIAVDDAGNALADAIGAAKDEWVASFAPAVEGGTERYRAALASALEALEELGRATAGRVWLEEFDVGLAHVGDVRQFHGGSAAFRVPRPQGFSANDELRADELLKLAATALDPPAKTPALVSDRLDRPPRYVEEKAVA
jgi:hypothetical protein